LTVVEFEIRPVVVVVRVPAKSFEVTFPNEIVVREGKIIGLAGSGVSRAESSGDPAAVASTAFDAAHFDVDLAAAFTRWAVARGLGLAGIPWWKQFSPPHLVFGWGAWGWLPADRRRAFLALHERQRVDVNGRPAVHPRIDVLFLRGLFGNVIDPGT
jgi:hypothetical protein